MELLGIQWKPELRKVVTLKDWERNPRTITGEALAKLKSRIEERGFHDVVKIDLSGTILSGTQRKRALLELGVEDVWAMVPSRELTEEEREKVVLESNRNDGEWDWTLLRGFDEEVLLSVGFDEGELMVNFGLVEAEKVDMADDRAKILSVIPPETGVLKERAAVKFLKFEDYKEVKSAIEKGKIGVTELLQLARK